MTHSRFTPTPPTQTLPHTLRGADAKPLARNLLHTLGAAMVCCALGNAMAQTATAPTAISWPDEHPARLAANATAYKVAKSNLMLDFHGSANNPDLVVFMAGNQYRAFPELVAEYQNWCTTQEVCKGVKTANVFYATLPPGKLIDAMASGKLVVGNFWFDVRPDALWPDVFMTGARQMTRLGKMGHVDDYTLYARNRGVVLLVAKGNPKNIQSVADLARPDVRVAISSPVREPASFDSYSRTLDGQGGAKFAQNLLTKPNTVSPDFVHHRENPQFIADGVADVAPMYFHFGDYLKTNLPNQFDYVSLPAEGNFVDALGIAKIKTTPRSRAADAWVAFLGSERAAAVYNKHGFTFAGEDERAKRVSVAEK